MPTEEQLEGEIKRSLRSAVEDYLAPSDLIDKVMSRHKQHIRKRIGVLIGLPVLVAVSITAGTVPFSGKPANPRSASSPAMHQSSSRKARPTSAILAVLDRVAHVAADAPVGSTPDTGQFLYVETQQLGTSGEGVGNSVTDGSVMYQVTQKVQKWISPLGGGRAVETPESVAFVTPADEQKWEAAGNNSTASLLGEAHSQSYPPSPSQCVQFCAGGLPYPNSANLPTVPSLLEQAIVQRYEHGSGDLDETWNLAGGLLQESASPQLREALYEMVASFPGVVNLGTVTDALGRTGEAVAWSQNGVQNQLIFDAATSAVLETRIIRMTARTGAFNVPAGTIISYTAYGSTGVVNSVSQIP